MSARSAKPLLLLLGILYAIAFAVGWGAELAASSGYLFRNGTPVGGDFINMWTVARLVLGGQFPAIYDPALYDAAQQAFVHADIGLRLWAYPPHSLLMVWPLGYLGYLPALALWSAFGLVVLGLSARKFGFDVIETAVICLSPAALASVWYGQTGNVATGLLLLSLAPGRGAGVAAALLTAKPQAGFLLPILWLVERRWSAIAIAVAGVLVLAAASVLWFGLDTWRAYLGQTLPLLDRLERDGDGAFMLMIPSAFMALRILGLGGDLAAALHLAFAGCVAAFLVLRLIAVKDATARAAMVLTGTVLVTPYMHNYDLAILLCGGLLVGRLWSWHPLAGLFIGLAWALPQLVYWLNFAAVPISPLLILPLLLLAAFPRRMKSL